MATKDISDKQVVAVVYRYSQNYNLWPYQLLAEATGECEKVCVAAIQRATDRGFLEYGTSLRTAWLTDKGLDLLHNR